MRELARCDLGLKCSTEWFAKLWFYHDSAASYSAEDVEVLVSMGIDETAAKAALEASDGDVDAALDAVLQIDTSTVEAAHDDEGDVLA